MKQINLTENEKQEILGFIQEGKSLPKEFIYKLIADDEDVFLFWNGRNEKVTNAVLPFHSIEHIDEPRKEEQSKGFTDDLFSTDFQGRQLKGWTNKLIWGDNRLILSSLVNGPLREEIEKQGGVKLIYIDPPFAVGADFSYNISVNGEDVTKQQSIIEEIAYRDTWGRGISSYLSMMYERLKLMHQLLAEDGSIYVHCDWRVSGYLRLILNDIFGDNKFQSEIIWKRTTARSGSSYYNNLSDSIIYYTKSDKAIWNQLYTDYEDEYINSMFRGKDSKGRYRESPLTAPGKASGSSGLPWRGIDPGKIGKGRHWAIPGYILKELSNDVIGDSIKSLEELDKIGRIVWSKNGMPNIKQYLNELPGVELQNIWLGIGVDKTEYPTQKPEALLERIIKASSNEGDLVADLFGGSGTTAAAAEKLGRKWVACDLGRFAIHTTRKRLIQVQRELKKEGKAYRAFEVLNLGKYERQFFFGVPANISQAQQEILLEAKHEKYLGLILEGYSALRIEGHRYLHGKKAGRFIHIGPLNVPVTKSLVEDVFEECRENQITQLDVLGFEFEMGLLPFIKEELRQQGVDIRLRYIPREAFDKRAVEKGQVKFYDVAYVQAKPHIKGKVVKVELTNFTTYYTQDDLEELEKSLKKGSSKVIIENGQITKLSKDKNGILNRELLIKKWTDWIDYWAVDFDYEDKKEIIRLKENDEVKEVWTGNYIFENLWQSFRTKKDPKIELTSTPNAYEKPGKYKIMVKVVDILGVDTSHIVEVEVK